MGGEQDQVDKLLMGPGQEQVVKLLYGTRTRSFHDHFAIISCKPYIANKACPCTNNIVYAKLKVLRLFVCFLVFLGFSHTKNYGQMYLLQSFSTVD